MALSCATLPHQRNIHVLVCLLLCVGRAVSQRTRLQKPDTSASCLLGQQWHLWVAHEQEVERPPGTGRRLRAAPGEPLSQTPPCGLGRRRASRRRSHAPSHRLGSGPRHPPFLWDT